MKRIGDLYDRIASFENLLWAAGRARRGKRNRPDVAAFHADLEANLLELRDELRSGTDRPSAHRIFWIRDPKPRTISAAPYRDRVVHHALCRHIGPALERGLIHDCWANREGYGTHRALDRCTQFCRRYRYVLKCDVVRYFPSMDRDILMDTIRRRIKCGRTLDLIARIVADAQPTDRDPAYFAGDDLFTPLERQRGIPIGNLTSQLFGNLYLSAFDHWVQETLGAPAYLRFVDDFLIFADDRAWLQRALEACRSRMSAIRLELHPRKCRVAPTRCGVEFLGWRVFPDHPRLRRKTGVRFQRRLRELVAGFRTGAVSGAQVHQSVMSWIGHLKHGDTWGLRTALLERAVFTRGDADAD